MAAPTSPHFSHRVPQEPLHTLRRLTAMAWSRWCGTVCTKAVPGFSGVRWTRRTNAGSASVHAVLWADGWPSLLKEQRCCRTCSSPKGIAFRLLSQNHNNLLFQPRQFTKTPLASDLTDLFSTSVGLLLTQTWLCIINLNTFMNLPLNKYFKGSIKFHSILLPHIAVFNFHTRCLS